MFKYKSELVFMILLWILAGSVLKDQGNIYTNLAAKYRTENVFLVVIDGVRYSETFGDPTHQFIPYVWNELRPLGTIYTNCRNNFITATVSGHTSMLTGVWQNVKDDGTERSQQPTVFEYYRKEKGTPMSKTWVVVQKMNLISTDYSDHPEYGKPYGANLDSPGLHNAEMKHTGDVATWNILKAVMDSDHPSLVMVNFGMTDWMGHSGNWSAYTNAIQDADMLVYYLWLRIQNDSAYKDKTTVFITSDHGRHLDGVETGFQDHGDKCEGCRHVMMLVIGPDTKVNTVINETRRLIDIAPTIGALMGFSTPLAKGNVMTEMLTENDQQLTSQIYAIEMIVIACATITVGGIACAILLKKKAKPI